MENCSLSIWAQPGYGYPYTDLAANFLAFVRSENDNLISRAGLSREEAIPLFDEFLKGYFDTEDQALIEQYKKEMLPLIHITQLLSLFVRAQVDSDQVERHKNNPIEALKEIPEITYQ